MSEFAAQVPESRPSIEDVLTDYIADRDRDGAVDAAIYAARLERDEDRQELMELIVGAARADSVLPKRLSLHSVLEDRYELLAPLGQGGMGQVWQAHDRQLDREVAVKVLNLVATASLTVDEVLEREAKTLARLEHPGIVELYETGAHGEYRYLVMRLVRGEPMQCALQQLRKRRDTERRALTGRDLLDICGPAAPGTDPVVNAEFDWDKTVAWILTSLLKTLEATHSVAVVHRDLKPSNIVLTGSGRPVLLDFGLSGILGSAPGPVTTAMFGTVHYIAPEQWEHGTIGASALTDIYQVGAILYEMRTLERCFPSENAGETMNAVRNGRFLRPRQHDPSISPELEAICLHAMEVRPQHRYPNATAFREDLERLLHDEPPLAAGPIRGVGRRTRSFTRRNARTLAVGAVGILGLAIGFLAQPASGGLEVDRIDGRFVATTDAPRRVLAFEKLEWQDGSIGYAPVTIRNASQDDSEVAPGIPLSLVGGRTELLIESILPMHSVARDLAQRTISIQSARIDDADASEKLDRVAERLVQISARVLDREEPVGEQLFDLALGSTRGSAGIELPLEELTSPGRWSSAGLEGVVLVAPE